MPELSVNRTLVKSPPELWAELSEVERLANHLGEFGQIRITKVEPEKTVAWEGEHGSGTVAIEASGWGTKVTLTAEVAKAAPPPPEAESPPPEAESPPPEAASPPPEAAPRGPAPSPAPDPPRAPEPRPPTAPGPTAPWPAETAPRPVEPAPAVAPPPPAPQRSSLPTEVERRGLLSRLFGRRPPASPPPTLRAPQPQAQAAAWHRSPASPQQPPAWQPPPVQPPPAWQPPASEPVQRPPEERTPEPSPEPPESSSEPPSPPEPALDADRALAVLEGALDNLGSAHHRPFSRN